MKFLARKGVLFVIFLTLTLFLAQNFGLNFLLNKWRKNYTAQKEIQNQYKFLSLDNWKKFSSGEGKFSILFPGTPEETNFATSFSDGPLSHVFYVNPNVQNAFAIGYTDSTNYEALSQRTDVADFLKKVETLEVSKEPTKIVFEQESEFQGYPAREFEYAAGAKATYSVRIKLILVRQRLYFIYVVFRTTNPYPRLRAIFFNSFSLN